jgi:7,8-dihydropterin-6-yl-methyl-4-(beta-D-ribofuranosyl)aminobenzene 5'-phosphate synthase
VDFGAITDIGLSHGHWDHASGLIFPFENVPTEQELLAAGATVICTDQAQWIGQGPFYLSGEIPRVTAYEMGWAGQVRRSTESDAWTPDPLVMDERHVSVNIKGRGQFIFSIGACFQRTGRAAGGWKAVCGLTLVR